MEMFIILGVVATLIALWMNLLACISLQHDALLESFQKKAQFTLVWLVPFIGASIVLHLVFEHSPNAIPKKWIPWPFKSIIFGEDIKQNKDRDDNEIDYSYNKRSTFDDIGGGDGD